MNRRHWHDSDISGTRRVLRGDLPYYPPESDAGGDPPPRRGCRWPAALVFILAAPVAAMLGGWLFGALS